MKLLISILTIAIVLSIGACSVIKNPKIISIEKVELIDNTDTTLIIGSEVMLYNPNWMKLSSSDLKLSIFIDTIYIGQAEIIDEVIIAKHDTANVSFILKIEKDCLSSNLNIEDSIDVLVLGSTSIPITGNKYYFEIKYKLDISEYISPIADEFIKDSDIKIKEVRIKSIDLLKTKFEVLFDLNNATGMEYQISKLDIEIYSSPSYTGLVGKSSIDEKFAVQVDTITTIRSNVDIDNLSMGSALFSKTINSTNSFYLQVNLIVSYSNMEIPCVIKRRLDYNPLTQDIKIHE